jgi:molybdate transport system substrate-binding protein
LGVYPCAHESELCPGNGDVFAAASLKDALDNASAQFTKDTDVQVHRSYAASSALARQIEQGAPADLFASADLDWMNYLAQKRLIRTDTRVNLLGNKLVVIASRDSPIFDLKLDAPSILSALGADGRLATGEVKSVPVGKYAKAAMEKLEIWSEIAQRVAMMENVRAALFLVTRGEAPLGIVYASDAKAEPRVKVEQRSHQTVTRPSSIRLPSLRQPSAMPLTNYSTSSKDQELFEQQGFTFLGRNERN